MSAFSIVCCERCSVIVKLSLSLIGTLSGISIFLVFLFYYHNYNAALWGFVTGNYNSDQCCLSLQLCSSNRSNLFVLCVPSELLVSEEQVGRVVRSGGARESQAVGSDRSAEFGGGVRSLPLALHNQKTRFVSICVSFKLMDCPKH